MTDIVDRLRDGPHVQIHKDEPALRRAVAADTNTMREAADEIERLRDVIERLRKDHSRGIVSLARTRGIKWGSWGY